ncbi:MAG: S9 family peptidase [Flavobacteriales bacterium]|nr:S9 family peptidase [Flavobacteriales bacterium]
MKTIIIPFIFLLYSINTYCQIQYPKTEKKIVTDIYFNTKIEDPYRWMENDTSTQIKEWNKTQNQFTFSYLDKIPERKIIKKRLEELWNYEKIGTPFKEGEYIYFYKNNGLQDQYVLYRKKDKEKEEVFIDPNKFSEDGTISLAGISFSKDGSLLAYSISEGGSDWRKVIVIDTENKKIIGDTLFNIKFSGISWDGNEGFYYSTYDAPEKSVLSDKTDRHKLFYHKLYTSQKNDKVIFGHKEKFRYVNGYITKDQKYLVISASKTTSGNNLFIKDLTKKNAKLIQITNDFKSSSYIVHNIDNKLYISTNLDAPNKKLVYVDANQPNSENWADCIPETKNVLNITKGGGYFFANYFIDANSKIIQYNYDGKKIREIKFNGKGNVSGFSGKEDQKEIFYNFSNYITPRSSFKYNVETGKSVSYWSPDIDFNSQEFITEQYFFNSKDGTKIPISIMYKKGIKLDGKNPTILYGYGGFNISLKPGFKVTNAVWLEQGGIYAVANLRGGGEYGKEWHDAGTKTKKQNVFDDFISAAEFLIDNKYTNSKYLAISGRSNGGLLVGACMTQRPELFKVALPAVGVLDMLRYHTFTSGAGWAYDYGTSDENEEMFQYLYGYSPVHNVKKGIEYPATLVLTGDHDDRVVPAHSFKFAAHLQDKQIGLNPTLIRIETNAGHGSGTPVSKKIEEAADVMGFILFNIRN